MSARADHAGAGRNRGQELQRRVLVSRNLPGVEPPIRTVETWLFDGWPDAEAVETWQLHETDGVTKLTMRLAFRDKAGRDHYPAGSEQAGEMTGSDGPPASFDAMEDILRSLLGPTGTSPS
jgi:hypothetical protein